MYYYMSLIRQSIPGIMILLLLATILFLLAFVFLLLSHEFLKRQIRRISRKRWADPAPRELDYPFFRMTGHPRISEPWQRFSRTETQIADRNDFIRRTAPKMFDRFLLQEQMLRLMLGASAALVTLDAVLLAVKLFRRL